MKRAILCMLLVMTATLPVRARAAEPPFRASLRGLRGVNVEVYVDGGDAAFEELVSSELLRSKIELRLRGAGVRVFDSASGNTDRRMPSLVLQILEVSACERDSEGHPSAFAISLSLRLRQFLWLPSKGARATDTMAYTWHKDDVMFSGTEALRQGGVIRDVDNWVDMFLNEWLAAHGK